MLLIDAESVSIVWRAPASSELIYSTLSLRLSGAIGEDAISLMMIPLASLLAPPLAGLPDGALGPTAAVLLFPVPCLPKR